MENKPLSIPSSGTVPLKILVVDDQEMNRRLLMTMLSHLGLHSEQVTEGNEAVQYCQTHEVDCILMDVNMPLMDGLQATIEIRKNEQNVAKKKKVIIVAITANAMMGDRETFLSSGMDFYIPKPIKIKDLRDVIGRCIQRFSETPLH
ncbi:MAG: response regulator [Verrucomicrobiota bacterium]